MESIELAGGVPVGWDMKWVPDVDDARPNQCPRCRAPARAGGRVVVQGHGVRIRGVVVSPALDRRPVLAECWARRYRCTACGAVPTVLPIGVLPRYLYSAFAIVVAFTLVTAPPVGRGLTDALAYKRQGMNTARRWHRGIDWRWRSIGRWAGRIQDWWPGLPTTIDALLAGLIRRAGSTDPPTLLAAAAASHVRWEAVM